MVIKSQCTFTVSHSFGYHSYTAASFVALSRNGSARLSNCGAVLSLSKKPFQSALNLLVMAFLLSMAYYSLNNMVCSILGEILFVQGKTILEINQVIEKIAYPQGKKTLISGYN